MFNVHPHFYIFTSLLLPLFKYGTLKQERQSIQNKTSQSFRTKNLQQKEHTGGVKKKCDWRRLLHNKSFFMKFSFLVFLQFRILSLFV